MAISEPTAADHISSDEEPIDLYREVHKGLRYALGDLVRLAGAVDPDDAASLGYFTARFEEADQMLQIHHGHEEGEQLVGVIKTHVDDSVVQAIETQHEESERALSALRASVADLAAGAGADQVYDDLVAFVAAYFAHLEIEEQQVMPALQEHVSADDLMSITMAIRDVGPAPADVRVPALHAARDEPQRAGRDARRDAGGSAA